MQSRFHHGLIAIFSLGFLFSNSRVTSADPAESLCLKSHESTSLEEMAIACYSDNGCAFVEDNKGETLRDYDIASVAAALGREKIEGIVTSSAPIMKQITGYGYSCKALP